MVSTLMWFGVVFLAVCFLLLIVSTDFHGASTAMLRVLAVLFGIFTIVCFGTAIVKTILQEPIDCEVTASNNVVVNVERK